MAVSIEELESFHHFASTKLNSDSELEWRDLFRLWMLENPTAVVQREVAAIIRQGDEDIAAGRGLSADEFNEELRTKYNLSSE